ncbi:MAG: RNA recognition motif domain-containing protein [Chitinophagales bacterium]
MDIYVGSIPFKMKETELKQIFEKHGAVDSVKIIIDKITRQNKGFAFVSMPEDEEAQNAIKALHGTELLGRKIIVTEAKGKENNR